MSKSETEQIAQLDERIKSLDNNLSALIKNAESFNEKISKADSSAIEGLKKEFSGLQQQYEDFNKKQSKLTKDIDDKLQGISRSRRNDSKIIEHQNKLLEYQKRLLSGDLGKKFSSLQGMMSSIDFESILQKVNSAPQRKESFTSQESLENTKKITEELKKQESQHQKNKKETKENNEELKKVEMTAQRLKNALVAAFGIHQIKSFLSNVVKMRGEFEMSEVALTNIIGNTEKAQLIWKKTMNLAVNSPLSAQQLTRYSKQLAAFRVETDKLYDTTKMLGDVSVGLGVDMERLILAYGHTKSSGFLRGMYARQFATAGVNIYGELAKYYTEVEGSLVTFRDVYERISKKLVSFADVEKVFEKITSKGGTFYNMQQLLSDTVQGQINKIKDSWQQALNDMGKSTQGTIRGITNIVLNLVKNWRTWLSVIEGVTAAFIAFKAINICRALLSVSYAANAASKSTLALAGALKSVFKNLGGNLPSLVTGLAVAAITVFATMKKHMDDYNREIDEQSITLYEAQQKMHDYQKRVEANNAVIKDSSSSEEQLKFARQDNLDVLAQLEQEYPEMYSKEMLLKDGEVELTEKIEAHNKSLKEQIRLNEELKQSSIFDDPFEKDTRQYFEQLNEWRKRIIKTQKELELQMAHEQLNIDEEPMVKALLDIDTNDILAAIAKYNEIIDGVQKKLHEVAEANRKEQERIQGYSDETAWWRALEETGLSHVARFSMIDTNVHAVREFSDESEAMVKEMLDGFELTVRGIESEQILIKEKYDKAIEDYMRESGIQTIEEIDAETKEILSRKAFSDYFRENSERLLEMVKTNTIDVNETIRTFLEAHGQALTDENKQVWNTILNDAINGSEQITKILSLAEQSWIEKNPFLKRFLLNQADKLRGKQYDFFAAYKSPTKGDGDDDGSGKTYKNLDELLELLKKMNSEYNKLSKSAYGFSKSQEVVMKNYKDAFDEILGKDAGDLVNWGTLDITSKAGLESAFKELEKSLNDKNLWGKYGKDVQKLQAKMKKDIANQGVEIDMNVQVRIRDDFGKQMEKAFNDYELTLELDKLNIPRESIKDLFPTFEVETLGELQDRMEAFYESQRGKDGKVLFDEEDLKAYKQWSDKIDAEILKSRKEKAKQYSKYLEKEYSERAKLEMQHAKDVAFVTANISDEKQRDNIVANLNRKFQQDLNELNWKSFKESSFYVDMMDDLASLPKEYMQTMLNKIDEILKHPETLSPRALKEAINARQKILEAQMNLEPLDVMKSSIKTIRKAMDDVDGKTWKQTKEKINDQIKTTQEEIDKLEEEARKWDEVAAKMKVYEDAADDVETAKNKLSTATKELVDKQGIEATITQYQDEQNENQKLIEGFQKRQLEGEKLEPTEKDQLAALQTRNGILGEQIAFLNEIISRERELQNIREEQHGSDAWARREEGYASTDIGGWSQGLKDKSNKPKQRIQNLKQYLQAFKNFDDSFAKFNAAINSTLNAVQGMGNAFYDMFDALGGETDALTEGWKEFGNTMITQITQTLTMIPMMVAAFTAAGVAINSAMGIIGLIAEAIQLVLVLITGLSKLHDAGVDKQIEDSKKKVTELQKAYDRLEKSIEKTLDTVSYMREFNKEAQNLYEQIEEANKQIAAAQDYKNEDKKREAIEAAEEAKQQALDSLDEIKQAQIEVFGGIGRDSYRSAAEGFVDAWKSAFLETGDGLQGLQDHFDEFLQDWFVKQATMRYASAALEPLFKMIDDAVDPNGPGGANVVMQELEAIKEWERVNFPQISDTIEEISRPFIGDGEGSLSGLAAGIQGMTEEQANILEAYWNSVRGYTASIDMNVARIVDMMVANYGEGRSVESNPMLQQLNLIAANTAATHTILQSVTKSGHTMGGSGIKVFLN